MSAYTLTIDAPESLQRLLATHLDLARFRSEADISDSEISRLMAAAPAQARALLETEGYFNATVRVRRVATREGQPQRSLSLSVDPGPQAHVSQLEIRLSGPLRQAADAGDARAVQQLQALQAAWSLPVGRAFRQGDWTHAKSRLLAELRANGYPASAWIATRADVDAERNQVRLTVEADSGPLFRFGRLQIEGIERYTEDVVRNLAPFSARTDGGDSGDDSGGDIYSDKLLLDFQERLQRSGLFDAASVEVDPDPARADHATVRVRVRERTSQQATVSVGYSPNTGQRVTLEHTVRRVFGLNWTALNKLQLGRDQNAWSSEFTSYPKPDQYRNLFSVGGERLEAGGGITTSRFVRIGRTQDTERIDRFYFGELQRGTVVTAGGKDTAEAASANVHWTWRDVDNILFPTEGLSASVQTAIGFSTGTSSTPGPFGRLYGRLVWYQPLGARWFLQGRIEGGAVMHGDDVDVPDTMLFRAGGDESVRGYVYRSIGPLRDGTVVGGDYLLTSSLELARPFSPRLADWWWAGFVDVGDAVNKRPDWHGQVGYGLGVRWRSPIGPLKADLAYGREVRDYRLHISVGIVF